MRRYRLEYVTREGTKDFAEFGGLITLIRIATQRLKARYWLSAKIVQLPTTLEELDQYKH